MIMVLTQKQLQILLIIQKLIQLKILIKTNIKKIESPIEKILQISGVTFNWKKDNRSSVGVIAQEIESVFPELVQGEDPKTVNYNGLIALLIECIKDQQIEINILKSKL